MSDIIKVIWFVDIKDEKEIKSKIGDRADFVFLKTLEEFKVQINKNNYLVFSVEKMNDSDNLTKIIHSNPDCIFHELFNIGRVEITKSHALSRLENNIKQGMWLDDILFDIDSKLNLNCDEIPNEETIKAIEDEELFSYDSMENNGDKKFYFKIEDCILEDVSLNEIYLFINKKYPVNTFLDNNYIKNKLEVELEIGEDYSSSIRTTDDLYCLPNFKIYYIKRTM